MDEFTRVELHKCYKKMIILKIHVISLKIQGGKPHSLVQLSKVCALLNAKN